MLMGALSILVCDDIARTVLPAEIPLGILTSLVGAVVFIVLMATAGKRRGA
jgi:iron complex transport system permease protein